MKNLKGFKAFLHWLAAILLIVGGLNWGLTTLFNFNIVTTLLGSMPGFVKFVYVLVGLSGVYGIVELFTTKTLEK